MGWLMACQAGQSEAKIPSASAAAMPVEITTASGVIANVWPSLPSVKLCQRRNPAASPTPTTPPTSPNIPPSLRTRQPIARPGNPSVRNTAFSFTRPRTTSNSEFATNAPTAMTEVRDLSKPPIRVLGADISASYPSWNEQQQRVVGAAWSIRFSGPAAPLDQVGKTVPAGAIRITPEVAGEWKWQQSDRLAFFPTAGWMPPGWYRYAVGDGLLAEDCELGPNTDFQRAQKAPELTAQFQDRNYYIDPATPTLQQLVTAPIGRVDAFGVGIDPTAEPVEDVDGL